MKKRNKGILKNKKGVFYTVIALLLVSTLIYNITLYADVNLKQKALGLESRVNTITNFIYDIESDVRRGIYISGYRALFNEVNYVTEVKGDYVSDSKSIFSELFLNGTINQKNNNSEWVKDNTFMNWTQKMVLQAQDIGIDLDIDVNDVEITQEDYKKVTIYVNLSLELTDLKGFANWSFDVLSSEDINLQNFEDPIYSVNTEGKFYNFITWANVTDFVDINDDTSGLVSHSESFTYINSNSSPNYLMRLEGDLSPDPNGFGMESLVNLDEFESKVGIDRSILNRSINDYAFFDENIDNHTGCYINNTPSWLKLEPNSLKTYSVENITIDC